MLRDAAHKNWWQVGEVIFGIPLLAAIILNRIAPVSFADSISVPILVAAGTILSVIGTILIIATRRVFSEYGQPTDPGAPTSSIITTSVFSVSRNPMYLGAMCLLVGIALIFKLTWMFIFLAPTLVACHLILIKPEEHYLDSRFTTDYRRYTASVFRWIGRKPQQKES